MKRDFYMKANTLFHESRLVLHSCGISLYEGGEGKFAEREGKGTREEEREMVDLI